MNMNITRITRTKVEKFFAQKSSHENIGIWKEWGWKNFYFHGEIIFCVKISEDENVKNT